MRSHTGYLGGNEQEFQGRHCNIKKLEGREETSKEK